MQGVSVKTINRISIRRINLVKDCVYVAYAPDGRRLEEFRHWPAARRWAKQTKDFVKGKRQL